MVRPSWPNVWPTALERDRVLVPAVATNFGYLTVLVAGTDLHREADAIPSAG